METQVSTILARKGTTIITVEAGATVFEAISKMVGNKVGSVFVIEGSKLVGIFTERDYLRRIALEGRTSRETTVGEVMTTRVVVVNPNTSVGECMALMTQQKCRHLPVMDGGTAIGVVSIGDCVKQVSADSAAVVQYMTDYITRKYPG